MKQLIVDTNLLVLLIVGLTDPTLIERHKRTKEYTVRDFDELNAMLGSNIQVVVTPHILAETSNLVAQTHESAKVSVRRTLMRMLGLQHEKHIPSVEIASHRDFIRLGLTDCGILKLLETGSSLITVDFDLYQAALALNSNVVNFNNLRVKWLIK